MNGKILAAVLTGGVIISAGCGTVPRTAAPKATGATKAQAVKLGQPEADKALAITAMTADGRPGTTFTMWEWQTLELGARISNPGGGALSYRWKIDGSTMPDMGDRPTYRLRPMYWGTYKATLTVTSADGGKVSKAATVIVHPTNPAPTPPIPHPPIPPIPHP